MSCIKPTPSVLQLAYIAFANEQRQEEEEESMRQSEKKHSAEEENWQNAFSLEMYNKLYF